MDAPFYLGAKHAIIVRNMSMRTKTTLFLFTCLCIYFLLPLEVFSQKKEEPVPPPESKKLTLVQAGMYEGIKENRPNNEAIVFSISLGRLYCFTEFDPVPEKTIIYHKWFRRDKLSTKVRLSAKPPRWSTFSRIRLREADKGPWRVEITDQEGHVFQTLRFSITD
jgi:hypothetical protein